LGLVIEVDKPATDTPARLQEKARDERQRVAEERIAGDPLVKNMEEKFGARLIPGSVRPLDE
jgi:DNA polymerase-3 subunit gamma/tau